MARAGEALQRRRREHPGRAPRPSMREGPLSELFRSTDPLEAPNRPVPRTPSPSAGRAAPTLRTTWPSSAWSASAAPAATRSNRMIEAGLRGVEFIAVNTDRQALEVSEADVRIPVGMELTRGLGTGGDPHLGEQAVRESEEQVRRALRGSDLVFIAAGEGGGTGTGGAPLVAKIAREMGALTVAVVTRPFGFEGSRRTEAAEAGLERLQAHRRHGHHHPQRPPDGRAGARDEHGRRVQGLRRPAAPGRAGHLRPDHAARAHQPRLRRRAHDHPRRGHGAARASATPAAATARPRRLRPRSPRRCSRPRSTAPAASCWASPAARTCRWWRSARPPGSSPTRPTRRRTSSSARRSTPSCQGQVWVTVVAANFSGVRAGSAGATPPGSPPRRASRRASRRSRAAPSAVTRFDLPYPAAAPGEGGGDDDAPRVFDLESEPPPERTRSRRASSRRPADPGDEPEDAA